ncbi:MAG: exodeoxyribonuclease VII large subunit [Candidatus Marinimicrobia bacterium]|nr:exodeoxyribonuclease VII large subunit [Candidatus Neomarinimicrobiota bacterium]
MDPTGSLQVLTVSELNRQAKRLLESNFTPVWLEGEISNFTHHRSGHMYFALKDERAQVSTVMFAAANSALPFVPANGLKVTTRGKLTLFEPRGQYQVVVENMYPAGRGELWLRLEELKSRLALEGLFEADRKLPLPVFPKIIGLITSPTGAAVQDVLAVLKRRAPQVTVVVRPTLVQGEQARTDIVDALHEFAEYGEADLLIITRGGGSLEDLWPFNEEAVARAVAECNIPTISAVGHETDVTICDLVADMRAPTPSAAAEQASGEREGYLQYLDERRIAVERAVLRRIRSYRQKLETTMQHYAFREPANKIRRQLEYVVRLRARFSQAIQHIVTDRGRQLGSASARLAVLNPHQVLERGYTLVRDQLTGAIISRRSSLEQHQAVALQFTDGRAQAEITRVDGE